MSATDQTPFAIGSDGQIRGVIDGRSYVGAVMTGSASDDAYHQILAAMLEADAISDFYTGGARAMIGRAKLLRVPGMRDLVRATVRAFTCEGVRLDAQAAYDATFAGRGWEPTAVALEAWQAQDFFLLPGMTPGKVAAQEQKRDQAKAAS
jgi:hypothetical protein